MPEFPFYAESRVGVDASPDAVFAFLDDHRNLSAHMEQKSWMMMGSRMDIHLDEGGARSVGSKFGFTGSFLGIPLSVEEIVTERDPPRQKAWITVVEPTLWVIGRYRMGFRIVPQSGSSVQTVFICYDLPQRFRTRWLGWLLSGFYAKWCTNQMAGDAARHFRHAIARIEKSNTPGTH
ncbi:SRPBCC family protein [Mesorhizobium sp. KR9-304]|uniref:SRPBCC family protein n=1 Tax=Mesorhizobium sp. KR9-304 TaxID=3156614 RepID=UPI0032B57670